MTACCFADPVVCETDRRGSVHVCVRDRHFRTSRSVYALTGIPQYGSLTRGPPLSGGLPEAFDPKEKANNTWSELAPGSVCDRSIPQASRSEDVTPTRLFDGAMFRHRHIVVQQYLGIILDAVGRHYLPGAEDGIAESASHDLHNPGRPHILQAQQSKVHLIS
jgi:hypothetical protein